MTINCQLEVGLTGLSSHFVGVSDEHIEHYESCETVIRGSHSDVVTMWQCADVSPALHSVSAMTGPVEGRGRHDTMFNQKIGVVVPAGVATKILERSKPAGQYECWGGLHSADVAVSSPPSRILVKS